VLIISVLIGVLALTACGSSAGPAEFTVAVKDEFNFDPANLTVSPGQEVTITLSNTGSVGHTFNVLKAGLDPEHLLEEQAGEDEHADEGVHDALLFDLHEVPAGETGSGTFTAPDEPGDYTIVCIVPGHAAAGMVGTLTVAP